MSQTWRHIVQLSIENLEWCIHCQDDVVMSYIVDNLAVHKLYLLADEYYLATVQSCTQVPLRVLFRAVLWNNWTKTDLVGCPAPPPDIVKMVNFSTVKPQETSLKCSEHFWTTSGGPEYNREVKIQQNRYFGNYTALDPKPDQKLSEVCCFLLRSCWNMFRKNVRFVRVFKERLFNIFNFGFF